MSPPAWFAFLCSPHSFFELVNRAGRQPWALGLSWKAMRQTSAGWERCWRWPGKAHGARWQCRVTRSTVPQVPPSVQHLSKG